MCVGASTCLHATLSHNLGSDMQGHFNMLHMHSKCSWSLEEKDKQWVKIQYVTVFIYLQHLAFWVQEVRVSRMDCAYAPSMRSSWGLQGCSHSSTPKPTHTFNQCCSILSGCQPHPKVNNLSLKLIWISYHSINRQPKSVKVKSTGARCYTHTEIRGSLYSTVQSE